MQNSGAVQSALLEHGLPEAPRPGATQDDGETVPQPGATPIWGVAVVNWSCVKLQQLQAPPIVVVVVAPTIVVVVEAPVVLVVPAPVVVVVAPTMVVVVAAEVVVVVAPAMVVVVAPAIVVVVAPTVVVVACGVVVVVAGAVVVVTAPQVPPAHASQQLGTLLTQALPPFGGLHLSAPRLMLQRVLPLSSVRQQATAFGRPHVERAAQLTTVSAHAPRSSSFSTASFTTRVTQSTNCPWFVAPSQSHSALTRARTPAMSASSSAPQPSPRLPLPSPSWSELPLPP
jgi:hypothetical protein